MKIKITFFGILMLLALIVTKSYLSLAALIAAFLHELGHLLFAKTCNVAIKELKLDIFGASITPAEGFSSYKKEIAVALGGPLVNLVGFAVFMPFFDGTFEFFQMFIAASAFLGILNLLPIEGFDGGRIIYCSLALFCDLDTAQTVISAFSAICLFLLWMLSVYFMITSGASLSMFVFSFALLCKFFTNQKSKIA